VLLKKFEVQNSGDSSFLESLHELISEFCYGLIKTEFRRLYHRLNVSLLLPVNEAQTLYNELFFDTSLEVGKTLSKTERDTKNLAQEKVSSNMHSRKCLSVGNVILTNYTAPFCVATSLSSMARWSSTPSTACCARLTPHQDASFTTWAPGPARYAFDLYVNVEPNHQAFYAQNSFFFSSLTLHHTSCPLLLLLPLAQALFAARFVYDFSKCVGIEILNGLHNQAEVVLNRYVRCTLILCV